MITEVNDKFTTFINLLDTTAEVFTNPSIKVTKDYNTMIRKTSTKYCSSNLSWEVKL